MKTFAWLRARPRALASAGFVTATAVAVTTMAVLYQGNPTTEVDLNDGGVWVTKQSSLLVGHFNHESQLLDGGLRTTSDDYDILQAGSTVLLVDPTASSVSTIDPAMVVTTDAANVPGGAKVVLGRTTVAILDPAKGSLWVVPAQGLSGFQVAGNKPTATIGPGGDVTVGDDGTVYAVSVKDSHVVTIPVDAEGEPDEPTTTDLHGLGPQATVSITAVGQTAVVMTDTGDLFATSGLTATVPDAAGAVLQQPSPAAPAVTVATAGRLVQIPFDGSAPVEASAGVQGEPAAPVSLNGCVYGAWSGSNRFVRDCLGDADDLTADVEGANAESQLRFRVNRDVVVLNDIFGGGTWMATDAMQQVDNWDDIIPPQGDTEDNDAKTTDETVETTPPERTEQNTIPVAVDDAFGVRPGRTTVLPVLDNDSDADGDVLTVTLPNGDPTLGPVQLINNGSGLQIAVPENATGSDSFVYQVDDGRGGTARATVRLAVHDWNVDAAPVQKRITAVAVESGGVITYNVMPDWIDPDGDDIYLSNVTPAEGDEVDFTSDGRVTYRAISGIQGRKDVEVIISDGTKVTAGVLRLDVKPAGSTVPVTNADHVVVRAGRTVTVSPLVNDTSSSAEPLRLTRVDDVAGATIATDFANKVFTFTSTAVGTYYVQYLVAAGPNAVPGLVRVDVTPDVDSDLPPIAVRDVALLPGGGDVLVDVLGNDVDPGGGILVVQSVTVAPDAGISVSVLNHETLRITDQSALDRQVVIGYTISNGNHSADGSVVVIPVPAPAKLRPPVANDDVAVVRAGDIVTIPVLDNDYSPSGSVLHVAPDLVPPLPDPADGTVFVSQDTVRLRAGPDAGTVYATYEVIDSTGQKDAGYITVQVLPVNEETNAAPRPQDITARVLSGSQVRIPVNLDGIDPDGDSVDLVGIASAPKKGRVVETGANYLVYEAVGGSTGVDSFTYRVRDRLGKEATATVNVGIAPAASVNQAPYAVKDSVVMRPGREVAVPVLANDSDPEGDAIGLVKGGLVLSEVQGLAAKVVGDRVVVTAPSEPVETSLQYTIQDARGAESTAVLQVTVDPEVPLLRPIARDDRVLAQDIDAATVDVPVLVNDEDPDGTTDALSVTVDGGARVLSGGVVRVTLTDTEQLLTYTITDQDGLTASAFIHVPSADGLPPTLISTTPLEVHSGETVDIPLADHVRASGGRSVVITEAAKVGAVHGNGAGLVKDQTTLVYTSAQGYFGADAITFEVTDGTGPDDPDGHKATLALPITVLPPDNQQPTFTAGQVNVAPGEDATTLDLAALTTDPDEGDLAGMTYSLVGAAPAGMSATIDGQSLRVSADAATAKGTAATLQLRISDGRTDPVDGTVTVTVTASTRPLATANDDVIAEAAQGSTVRVPVLGNDFNPFPDRPLKVTAAVTETGDGIAEVSGDEVAVTPSSTFVGTMVVRYRVQDATGDRDREVEGHIRITVQGRPDAPGKPTVSSVQDRTVVLSWTPPVDNGAPITGYTVTSTKGDYRKACPATTCTLDGLTNNVEYNFTVTATNRVGESPASVASETARPDARPDTPNPPTLAFGDKSLTVNWVTPPTPGSPVESFNLEISPAPPSGIAQKVGVKGNSMVWDGLENGVAYQVRVQAVNRAPEPSSWSAWSATEIPAGPPAAAGAPSVQRLDPVGSQSQLQVSWTPPGANGAAIDGYQLDVVQGGSVVNSISVPGGQSSQAVVVNNATTDYTFRVRAHNKAGWGAYSADSAPRRAFGAPGAPTNVQASTPAADSAIVVTYGAAPGNGANAGELQYEYSLNGGNWQGNWDGRTIGGLSNGTSYTVRVRAFTALDGVRYDGAESAASNGAVPYGPVGTPGASASASGRDITFGWSAPAENGRPISQVQVRYDGGGWQNVSNNGSDTKTYGYSEKHTIEVRATDSAGQVSDIRSASDTTVAEPKARAWVTAGSRSGVKPGCESGDCNYFVLNTENFPAGSYRIFCAGTGGPGPDEFIDEGVRNIPANGSTQLGCFYGYHGSQVWVRIEGWGESDKTTWP